MLYVHSVYFDCSGGFSFRAQELLHTATGNHNTSPRERKIVCGSSSNAGATPHYNNLLLGYGHDQMVLGPRSTFGNMTSSFEIHLLHSGVPFLLTSECSGALAQNPMN